MATKTAFQTKATAKAETAAKTAARQSVAKATKPALQKKIDKVKKLLGAANSKESEARYEIGKVVLEIIEGGRKYGEHAVEKLETALGLDRKTLYRYGTVAAAWTQREFGGVRRRKNSKRVALSWSHFELLAPLKKEQREPMLNSALKQALSVRALSARIDALTLAEPRNTAENATSRPTILFEQIDHLVERAEKSKQMIFALSGELPVDTCEEMKAALDQWRKLKRLADEVASRMAAVLGEQSAAGSVAGAVGRMLDPGMQEPEVKTLIETPPSLPSSSSSSSSNQ